MSIWRVVENGQAVYIVCGSCAVDFYNASRETRTAPEPADAPEGAKVRSACAHELKEAF